MFRTLGLAVATGSLLAVVSPASSTEQINFNRDVRPILSDRCYFCHGPDASVREADLRLDQRDAASYVIESGDLVERITSDDPDMRMPPPHSKLALTDQEKETIKAWIEQGAPYQGHWALQLLPDAVDTPQVSDPDWCRATLDRFILARLDQENMEPSPEASPLRWLRRVTLDLTGLPPTPAQIADFENAVAADPEQARVDAVETLLASPGFGEHMAIAWLDAARYADSYGYQSDKLNTQWPYRDWVVEAFNKNLPYDEFLTHQIAGDLLDNPTREQMVATAFNRLHRLNNEGGAVFEEWRLENVADRVHTFGTAILGLTLECCRCHDHKYDPIPTRDYYALSAFFNSIDESGVYDHAAKIPCPSILLPTAEQQAALDDAIDKLAGAEEAYQHAVAEARERYEAWTPQTSELKIPDLRLALSFDRDFDDSLTEIYHLPDSDRGWTALPKLVAVAASPLARLDLDLADDVSDDNATVLRRALALDGDRGVTTRGVPPFDRYRPMSVVISMRETRRGPHRSIIAHHSQGTDCGYNGWDLSIEDGRLESRMARVWPGNAMSVRALHPLPEGVWHQVAATYDGSSSAAGLKLFLNGEPLETTIVRNRLKKSCNVSVGHGGEFVVGQRFRSRGLDGGLIDDVRVYDRALTEAELRNLATGGDHLKGEKPTFEYFVSAVDPGVRSARESLTAARKAVVMAEEVMHEIPVMQEMDQPRPTHVLARGEYNAPTSDDTLVDRDTLSELPIPFPADAPKNRLGLARWVTDPHHPLTARVAVNRFWGKFFSAPLVRTPENFGSQGELPTHPELLDWLARDFIDNGWDVKRLCKMIVLSATYRQDSAASPEQMEADPPNRLLARGPAYRLAAEQIRDLVLAASGLMNFEVGGPPVSPYQPGEDLWKESNSMSPPFKQSVGQSLYRRSLYSVWKRTAPLPNMMAFDSTTREVCTVKRSRTNTPLQALVLLNDVQFIEASRVIAEQLIMTGDEAPVATAFLRLAGRRPDEREQSTLQKLLASERAYYAQHPEAAAKLLSLGDSPAQSGVDSVEVAALTNVCQAILNLDVTIWKR